MPIVLHHWFAAWGMLLCLVSCFLNSLHREWAKFLGLAPISWSLRQQIPSTTWSGIWRLLDTKVAFVPSFSLGSFLLSCMSSSSLCQPGTSQPPRHGDSEVVAPPPLQHVDHLPPGRVALRVLQNVHPLGRDAGLPRARRLHCLDPLVRPQT